jgi:Leucine-rich repeat (LRR) protein
MKKLTIFAAFLLAVGLNYSCSEEDVPVNNKTVIELDGKKYETDLVAVFSGDVGTEFSLTLGVYDNFDVYGVDFGDGKIVVDTVCYQNGGLKDESGMTVGWRPSATTFAGTIAGTGEVKVYGNSPLWYLVATGDAMLTDGDKEKLDKVVQMGLSGINIDGIELFNMQELESFSITNSPIQEVDVTKNTKLTSLTIVNTTESAFEPQLESIDLSGCPNLENLTIGGSFYMAGKLASLDLSKNTALKSVAVGNNKLKSIKLPAEAPELNMLNLEKNELTEVTLGNMPKMKNLYLAENQLTTVNVEGMTNLTWFDVQKNQVAGDLDLTVSEKLANVYVNNNQLTSVKVSNVTKQFYFDNNKMTFATMPDLPEGMNTDKKKKQFHYAPQADMEVALSGKTLDLSAQATAKGLEAEPQATEFFITAGNEALVADKDYKIENGKIEFLVAKKDVIVKMTNAGFPDLNLTTVPFDVK